MRFQVLSNATVIGESNFEGLDPPMGIAMGEFVPSEGYQEVLAVFRLYAEAVLSEAGQDREMLERYWRERDALNLTIRLTEGDFVPVTCVHIEDWFPEMEETRITVAVGDYQVFQHYFEQPSM